MILFKYWPIILSQTLALSHVEQKGSYSGAPLHMATFMGAGINVLYTTPLGIGFPFFFFKSWCTTKYTRINRIIPQLSIFSTKFTPVRTAPVKYYYIKWNIVSALITLLV